jgi:uncharacterized protein (DUF362 family)
MAANAWHSTAVSPPAQVAAIQRAGAPIDELLDAALSASGFWQVLSTRRASRKRRKRDLAIAVKPDLDVFARDAATGTNPALVEALIARLYREGYTSVVVCDGRNRSDGWLTNRDALCVPDLVGYRFETPAGEPYTVSWVDDDPRVVRLSSTDTSDVLRVHGDWVRADVRISFAKAKTDDTWTYALNAANMLGLISPSCVAAQWSADDRAYHLLRCVPPHIALVDATVGSHGSAGSRISNPIATDTIIASPSALLADWVCAMKMGVDPYASPLNALALQRLGLPTSWQLEGDASPWDGWMNPPPALVEAVQGRARWPELDAFVRAVLQPTDREHFAFRDVIVDQVSSTVLSRLDRVTDQRVRDWVDTLLAGALNMLAASRAAFTSNVTKGDVIQSTAPLTIDVDALTMRDFDETSAVVAAQRRVLDGAVEDARGFRFRTIGGHIHFAASRQLPIAFDEFVARVDVSASIRHMNDYVGGSWTVIETDERGRAVRQAERNIYLPQPNWTGVFGGSVIDVEKVEQMTYTADQHEIRWRTVSSRNDSAESDDGSVIFARTGSGQVEVRIFARQRFRLPSTLAATRIELWPAAHRELAADAYSRFFDGTLANFRAAYEGRPYRIGKPVPALGSEDPSDLRAFLSGAIAIISRVFGWAAPNGAAPDASGARVQPLFVDELGFSHFAGPAAPMVVAAPAWAAGGGSGGPASSTASQLTPFTFLSELGRAVGKDIAALGVPLGGSLGNVSASGGEPPV